MRGADVVVTATAAREPIVQREWFADGVHINAVGSSIPTTRELDGATVAAATLFVDRRESTVNEAGDYLMAVNEGAIAGADHITAELGEVFVGHAPGPHLAGGDHALQVARHRDGGSRRGRGRPPQGAGAGSRLRGAVLISLEAIRQAREALAGTAVRTPLVRLRSTRPPRSG